MEPSTLKSITFNEAKHPLYFPKRFVVVILGFVGILMTSTVRGVMSVAMVAMTDHSANHSDHHSPITSECPVGTLHSTLNGTSNEVYLGACLPSMSAVVSKWSPKLERSVIMTIVFTGAIMSTVIASPISGWLTSVQWVGGWPAIFYCTGVCGCVWSVLWICCVYESPGLHPSITQVELSLFLETPDSIPSKELAVPWKAMFRSLPLWSVLIAQSGVVFTFNILMVGLPSYLTYVLHFNIKTSSALSMLPFLAESIGGWASSIAADKTRASGKWSITAIRKFFNCIGGFVQCLCLLGITFSGCSSSLILGLLVFGMFVGGCEYAGFHPAFIDMTPDFAGTMYSLCYGTSSVVGIAGPQMVGVLTASGATIQNWSKVFYVTFAVKFVSTTFFAIFASAELQPWGKAAAASPKQLNGDTKC